MLAWATSSAPSLGTRSPRLMGHFGAFPCRKFGTRGPGRGAGPRPHAQSHLRGVRTLAPARSSTCTTRASIRPADISSLGIRPALGPRGQERLLIRFRRHRGAQRLSGSSRRSVDRMIDDYLASSTTGTWHRHRELGHHHLTYNMGGYPRNYLRVPTTVSATSPARRGPGVKAITSSSPRSFVRMHAGQADIGDLVAAPSGHAAWTSNRCRAWCQSIA